MDRKLQIEEVSHQIVDMFHPDKIILFGSYARGNSSSDSDVDLLVSLDTSKRSIEQAVEIRKKVHFPFPTDLLVRTPSQLLKRIQMGDPFIMDILKNGLVLYEAHHA